MIRRLRRLLLLPAAPLLCIPQRALAAATSETFTEHTLVLVIVITMAAWSGYLFERMKIPELVGQIFAGILLGNLDLLGFDLGVGELLRNSEFMTYAAELGVLLLLFLVGLESNIRDLLRVGYQATLVAVVGVILPVLLGFAAAQALGFATGLAGWFIGATLAATSVGITARTLSHAGVIYTPSSQLILGAAVIDDLLGILLLAVLANLATTGSVSATSLMLILVKAIGFFVVAIVVGRRILPGLIRITAVNQQSSFLTGFALCTALTGAYVAAKAGLAPIIGAFVAGLLLDDAYFVFGDSFKRHTLEGLLAPITNVMLTIFFVSIGAQVELEILVDPAILLAVTVLLLVAIASKGVCGFVLAGEQYDKLGIGAGMIPRGEVGLIFAAYALAHHVFDARMYSVIVLVVLLTTIAGPILLARRVQSFAAPESGSMLACRRGTYE